VVAAATTPARWAPSQRRRSERDSCSPPSAHTAHEIGGPMGERT
jgi:hypothetical protein